MKKIVSAGLAALTIAGGSVAVAVVNPLSIAAAQTDATTTTQAPAATTPAAPADGTATRTGPLDQALSALVTDGTLTQAQADAVKAKVDTLRPAKGDHDAGRGPGRDMGRGGPVLEEAATFLGTTAADLRTQLEGGATLATIAGDKTQALIDSIVASSNTRIDAAVTAGRLDAAKATELKANTVTRITNEVNGVKPAGKGPGGHGGHGRGSGTAPAAPSSTTTTN
jgi:hypothetical protein